MASVGTDEPVLVGAGVSAVIGWVLAFLVTHGILTDTQASTLTQTIVPAATAAAVALLGLILRHFVSPASKVKGFLESDGLLSDADWGRFEGLLMEYLGANFEPAATAAHDPFATESTDEFPEEADAPAAAPVPPVGDSMNAGAPPAE